MSAVFRFSALATSLALAACAVGPDHERPASVVSARFARDESQAMQHDAAPAGTSADADAAFWRGFGDPALTRLIDAALAANQDLQLAVSRYDASNALLRETRFDRIPTISASGQIGHRLTSKDQAFGAPRDQRDKPTSSVGINAAWELDLFGRVRRAVEAQRAETAASAADVRALRIAIAGEVARAYVDLRGSQERLRIARENADNQRQTLALIDARVGAGRGSELERAAADSARRAARACAVHRGGDRLLRGARRGTHAAAGAGRGG
ncbi:outer membrane efflux family protein [Burkholderia sp. MSHR3999]|nr:outer membrane efflux family protein [Burkholderia sp. MSHR3999]